MHEQSKNGAPRWMAVASSMAAAGDAMRRQRTPPAKLLLMLSNFCFCWKEENFSLRKEPLIAKADDWRDCSYTCNQQKARHEVDCFIVLYSISFLFALIQGVKWKPLLREPTGHKIDGVNTCTSSVVVPTKEQKNERFCFSIDERDSTTFSLVREEQKIFKLLLTNGFLMSTNEFVWLKICIPVSMIVEPS
jgi:hypothetical protein